MAENHPLILDHRERPMGPSSQEDPTAQVLDRWGNAALGHGTSMDPLLGTVFQGRSSRSSHELDLVYESNGLARKIVDIPVDDALRKGVIFSGLEGDEQKALSGELSRLKILSSVGKARKWARLFGGGGIVVRVEGDQGKLHEPLDLRSVRRVTRLEVADRHDLRPEGVSYLRADGQGPEFYSWTTAWRSLFTVHHSRVIRFEGLPVTARRAQHHEGWGIGVLDLLWEELERVGLADQGLARLVSEFSQAVLSVPDLMAQISQNGVAGVAGRYALMRSLQSVMRMIVISGEEKLERHNAGATGLSDLVYQLREMLASVADIPVVRLYGVSPGGLNATGATDLQFYYDKVISDRTTYLDDPMDSLLEIVLAVPVWGKGTRQRPNPLARGLPEDWDWEFPPIQELTELELADLRLKTAQTDAIEIGTGVLDPDEVALSRYGSGSYSTETQIRSDLREIPPE